MSYYMDEMCKLYAFLISLKKVDDNVGDRYYGYKDITQEDIYEFCALIRNIIDKNTIIVDVDKMVNDIRVSEHFTPSEMVMIKEYKYNIEKRRAIDSVAIGHLGTIEAKKFEKEFDEQAKREMIFEIGEKYSL